MASKTRMVRYGPSTCNHGIGEMNQGATKAEIIEVLSLVSMMAGFSAFIAASKLLVAA